LKLLFRENFKTQRQNYSGDMKYKGYEAVVRFDEDAKIFHGEVIYIKDVITFQEYSNDGLRKAFEDSVEDYLAFCKERGEEADKPFSGNLVS